jgi:hypothetical protein
MLVVDFYEKLKKGGEKGRKTGFITSKGVFPRRRSNLILCSEGKI